MPALTTRAPAHQDADERYHAARRIVTLDREPRCAQTGRDPRGMRVESR